MKFATRTEEDGKVVLSLGLSHEVGFPAELDVNAVVEGVNFIVNEVCGISVQELAQAVLQEYEKGEVVEQPVS